MRSTFIRRFAFIVLFLFLNTVISPHFMFANTKKIMELEYAEKFYKQGNYDGAMEMVDTFLNKYKNYKNKYRDEFTTAYYYKAKIFFELEELAKAENVLKKLFSLKPDFGFPGGEDSKFIGFAQKIRARVQPGQRDIRQDRSYEIKIKVTNLTDPIYVSWDRPDTNNAQAVDPGNIKLQVNKAGKYTLCFIKGGKYIDRVLDVKGNLMMEIILDFKKNGKSIREYVASQQQKKIVVGPSSETRKKKKFPLLLVIGGAIIVAAALVYFFVLKDDEETTVTQYTLTVSPQPLVGVTGNPAVTTSYDENTVVPFEYTLAAGYKNLRVQIDEQTPIIDGGLTDPDDTVDGKIGGNITMAAHHTIAVSAELETP